MKRFNESMTRLALPPEWLGPLRNPCKGWIAEPINSSFKYGKDKDIFSGYIDEYNSLFSVAYKRFNWKTINPQKGVYCFEEIDCFLEAVENRGWTAGIGFLTPAASTSPDYSILPDYMFEEGMQYIETEVENNHNFKKHYQRVPVWNDPIYLKYCEELIEVLAERYDGDSRIFYINPLTYGNWGEWHTQYLGDSEPLTFEEAKHHVLLWEKHFKKSILQIPVNHHMPEKIAMWACDEFGWGMTRWGLVYLQDDHYAASYCLNTAPALGEFYTFYENTKNWGAWSDERMTRVIEEGHLTNIRAYADDYNLIYVENRNLINNLQNRMGYHIVAKEAAEFFESNEANEREFGVIIENKGVAPMYFDCELRAAILDDKNQVIKYFDTGINPRKWYGNSNSSFRFRIPTKDIDGKVSIGLFKNKELINPDVQFANSQLVNGWLVLC